MTETAMQAESGSVESGGDMAGIVLDQADRLLGQHVTADLLARCDGAVGDAAWPADLWRTLEESGLPLALVPEAAGGIGLAPGIAARLIRRCGYFALPMPLPETLVGEALWAAAGGEPGSGALSLAPAGSGVKLAAAGDGCIAEGRLERVAWGGRATALLVDAVGADGKPVIVRLPARGRVTDTHRNLAGEPRDTLDISGLAVAASQVRSRPAWLAEARCGAVEAAGAWARAQQIVGALERCLAYAIDYAGERQQFGRPIAKFQAVQHMLAEAAGHVAAATAAADLTAAAWGSAHFELAVSIAKSRCGEAAGRVSEICQQVHGAMGFTHEHPLHYSTRRLWSWRDEFGHEALWQERIGRAVCAVGGDALWDMLVRLRAAA